MGKVANGDEELKVILDGIVEFSGKLANLQMPDAKTLLHCKTSGEVNSFYVSQILRNNVFESKHGLSHPGIRASRKLICSK